MQWNRLGIEQTLLVLGAYQFLDAVYWLWHIKTSCKHQACGSLGSYKEIKVKFCTHTRLTLSDCTQSCIYVASKDPAHTHTHISNTVCCIQSCGIISSFLPLLGQWLPPECLLQATEDVLPNFLSVPWAPKWKPRSSEVVFPAAIIGRDGWCWEKWENISWSWVHPCTADF